MRYAWRTSGVVLVVVLGVIRASAAAERPWLEVRSPHFVVVSDAGEKEARDIAWQFEQGRTVFSALWPWARQDSGTGFVVFGARDEGTLRALAPGYFKTRGGTHPEGVYVSGRDADYVALRLDVARRSDVRVNPYLSAFAGYADNMVVRHFEGRVPMWLRKGLSQLYGNTIILDNAVQVGRVIPWYLERLAGRIDDTIPSSDGLDNRRQGRVATGALLPLPRLLAARYGDPEVAAESARDMFDAQSWAFVHYLMFGEGGKHRAKLDRLTALLQSGVDGDEATATALGDVSALADGYRDYITQRAYQYQKVGIDVDVSRQQWPARPLPVAEAEVFKARFLVAMGEPDAARERIAAARAADPSFAGIPDAEAVLEGRVRRATAAPPSPTPPPTASAGPELIAACSAGDLAACGRLVPGLQKACDGDGAMCMPLAFLYHTGRGVLPDLAKAEALYARGCEAGQARACEKQARLILDRSSADADVAQARGLLDRACAAGQSTACGGTAKK